jgi:drug/metabolite transporter (DMT)-like permease
VIVAGAVVLTLDTSNLHADANNGAGTGFGVSTGVILLALACLFWAIDNNLTRKIAAQDALFIAACKGWTAGLVNTSLGLYLGATLPPVPLLLGSLSVGFLGYGLSLVLFIWALRGLGTGRTGAYFSCAPFAGAAVSMLVLGEATTVYFWLAALLMALGVWLHLTERHEHEHEHLILGQAPLRHSHPHYPDAEHQHQH